MFKKGLILATVLGGVVAVTTAKYLKEKFEEAESEKETIIGYRFSVESKSEHSITRKEIESYDVDSLYKAVEEAKKNLVRVPVINHTIPHQTSARYGGADIFLRPASHGTGLIAGGAVRAVLESAGVHDVLSKSKGSSNPHNVVKATFKALLDIRRPEEIARMRGISLNKVFNG